MEELIMSNKDGIVTVFPNKDKYGGVIQFDNNAEPKHSVYSDRMYGWNSKKYNECCRSIWNDESQVFYDDRTPEEVERFLRAYTEDETLTLCRIIRYERIDGYSVWRFDYNTEKKL